MKTLGLMAAAAAAMLLAPAVASAAPVAAPAAPTAVTATALAASATSLVSVQDRRHHDRRWRGHGRRASWRTVCTRKWRHGRSVRVCRKVRGWR